MSHITKKKDKFENMDGGVLVAQDGDGDQDLGLWMLFSIIDAKNMSISSKTI